MDAMNQSISSQVVKHHLGFQTAKQAHRTMTITHGHDDGDTAVHLTRSSTMQFRVLDDDTVPDSEGQSAEEDGDDSESEVNNELRLQSEEGHRDPAQSNPTHTFVDLKELFEKEMRRTKLSMTELKLWLKKHENEICTECKEIKRRCNPNPNGISCLECRSRYKRCSRVKLEKKERIMRVLGISEKQYEEWMEQRQNEKVCLEKNRKESKSAGKRKREEGRGFDANRENDESKAPVPIKTRKVTLLVSEEPRNKQLTVNRSGSVPTDNASSGGMDSISGASFSESSDIAPVYDEGGLGLRKLINGFIVNQRSEYRVLKALQHSLSALATAMKTNPNPPDKVAQDLSDFSGRMKTMIERRFLKTGHINIDSIFATDYLNLSGQENQEPCSSFGIGR